MTRIDHKNRDGSTTTEDVPDSYAGTEHPDDSVNAVEVAAAIDAAITFSGALVKKAADQTGANYSAFTNISFDNEGAGCYDTDDYHSNSVNPDRLTAPVSGYYHVAGLASIINLVASDYARAEIKRYNSAGIAQGRIGLPTRWTTEVSAALGLGLPCGPSAPVWFDAGDYAVFAIDTEADASIDLESDETWFSMWRVVA